MDNFQIDTLMKKKPVVLAIVGSSGSGKTSISLRLRDIYKIPPICSYTTRPIREGETDGVEHFFVTEDQMPPREAMCAYTFFGGYHYWTALSQFDSVKLCTYVIDEKGLLEMIEKYSDRFDIIKVKVVCGNIQVDQARLQRDDDRICLEDNFYNFIIHNNSTLDYAAAQVIVKLKDYIIYGR
jgi:guanylate kinase